jgi:hypothetical protein
MLVGFTAPHRDKTKKGQSRGSRSQPNRKQNQDTESTSCLPRRVDGGFGNMLDMNFVYEELSIDLTQLYLLMTPKTGILLPSSSTSESCSLWSSFFFRWLPNFGRLESQEESDLSGKLGNDPGEKHRRRKRL